MTCMASLHCHKELCAYYTLNTFQYKIAEMNSYELRQKSLLIYQFSSHDDKATIVITYVANPYCPKELPNVTS